jgi:uncharacterized coiled-coil protein SlyX
MKITAEENAQYPPGMRLMSEDERLDTLEMLLKAKEDTMQEYNKLPIAANSLAVKRKRDDLEAKLQEIEKALKTFTRPKVYVAV